MEAYLNETFYHLLSCDIGSVSVGLSNVESILAQITLRGNPDRPKGKLQKFLSLQAGFEYNLASRLINVLSFILTSFKVPTSQSLTAGTRLLRSLNGTLLIHRPSQKLFGQPWAMNLILNAIQTRAEPGSKGAVQEKEMSTFVLSAVEVLETTLLECPRNSRIMEERDGLAVIVDLLKTKGMDQNLRIKALEFLYFYLLPEAEQPSLNDDGVHNRAIQAAADFVPQTPINSRHRSSSSDPRQVPPPPQVSLISNKVRSTAEKRSLLSAHIADVDTLLARLGIMIPIET